MVVPPVSLSRGEPLRSDPAKTKAWQQRSRKALPRQSARRKRERSRRAEVRAEVLARDGSCQARGILPGRCQHLPGQDLDVHEMISRGRWAKGYLDPSNCVALCRRHHDYATTHPDEAEAAGLYRRTSRVDNRYTDD